MGKKRFDLTQVIKTLDGSNAMQKIESSTEVCKACNRPLVEMVPYTLRDALMQCLVSDPKDPRTGRPVPAKAAERYRRVKLALRIDDAKDTIRLSIDEIKDLKDLVPQFLTPVGQTRVWDILDPQDDDDEVEEDNE